ncbi:hypothetical protein K1719_035806 [Acacia pycnantha]|nr:hypothetical protein K1719_035806 [Acacia pycnantha]
MGNSIGKAIRLDVHTAKRAKGRFARMCVELDLNKPLVPEFNVEGQLLSVVYESLGQLCNKYGRVGHLKDGCDAFHRRNREDGMAVDEVDGLKKNVVEKDSDKGLWKTVQRVRRPRHQDPAALNHQSRSRFAVLQGETGEEQLVGNVVTNQGPLLSKKDTEKGQSEGQNRSRAVRGKYSYDDVMVVLETNLEPHKWHEVHMDDKENLNLGECMDTARQRYVGVEGGAQDAGSIVEHSDGVFISIEEICPTVAMDQ